MAEPADTRPTSDQGRSRHVSTASAPTVECAQATAAGSTLVILAAAGRTCHEVTRPASPIGYVTHVPAETCVSHVKINGTTRRPLQWDSLARQLATQPIPLVRQDDGTAQTAGRQCRRHTVAAASRQPARRKPVSMALLVTQLINGNGLTRQYGGQSTNAADRAGKPAGRLAPVRERGKPGAGQACIHLRRGRRR
jgi:hypothetical protein